MENKLSTGTGIILGNKGHFSPVLSNPSVHTRSLKVNFKSGLGGLVGRSGGIGGGGWASLRSSWMRPMQQPLLALGVASF